MRMAVYEKEALPIALKASRAALRGRTDITHLVAATCSGFSAPGFDVGLIRALGLPPTTQRTPLPSPRGDNQRNSLAGSATVALRPIRRQRGARRAMRARAKDSKSPRLLSSRACSSSMMTQLRRPNRFGASS